MDNLRYKTAITRKKPSKPMTILENCSQFTDCHRKLDYGCGKGFDADYFGMEKYDPHFFPDKPTGLFDTITCNYVLNVIPDHSERVQVLKDIQGLLADDNSMAFIAVRRDLKHDTNTQFLVELNLPTIYKDSATVIYFLTKGRVL
jgi:ATP adenylyltransferase